MCWSFQASFTTWIIGLITAIILFARRLPNDITLGCLILTYSSMQLWEAMMWSDQKCGDINKLGTKLAYFALWSHVLAIGVGLYIEKKAIAPIMVGVLLILTGIIMVPSEWKCSKPPSGSRHLKWGFEPDFYMIVFGIAILLCLYYIKPVSHAVMVSGLFIGSFILCYLYASKSKTTGSFWCWCSAAFSFLFLILPYLKF